MLADTHNTVSSCVSFRACRHSAWGGSEFAADTNVVPMASVLWQHQLYQAPKDRFHVSGKIRNFHSPCLEVVFLHGLVHYLQT